MIKSRRKKKTNTSKWDVRFTKLAREVSTWSLDPSTQTGAVIVDKDRRIVSVGYNGLPKGVEDTHERLNNRELKYSIIVHCEVNSLLFANKSCKDCTLFTFPFMSCSRCCSIVINAGITRCVAPLNDNPRWKDSFLLSQQLFKEAGVEVELLDPSLFT